MSAHFYCQNLTGEADFSIDVWSKAFTDCVKAGLSEAEMSAIIDPPPACEKQCADCLKIVADTRAKNTKSPG